MKKWLSLLLSGAMLLTLFAACSSGGSSSAGSAASETSTAAEATTAAEETAAADTTEAEASTGAAADTAAAADFTWNGQMEVWSILPTTGAQGLVMINDAMGAMMEAEGFTYEKKDAQGDPSKQVEFVEDAINAGNVGCLMIAAMSVDMLKDVVGQAIDKGIAVAYLGAEPTDYTIAGCVYTAYEITGMYAVEAAQDWIENSGADIPTNADGKYEVACDVYTDIQDGVYRSNAMIGTVDSSDNLVRVSTTSSYGDSAFSDANNNAADVLNAHPDCHIFIAYEPEEAMGINAAITDYCEQNGLDLKDYCVIPCYGEDEDFQALYAEAEADPSANAIKGYSTYGDEPVDGKDTATLTGEHLGTILLGVTGVGDSTWTYGETYYDTIQAVNICGFSKTWKMGDENPAIEYKTPEYIG